jgi:hypothetical protein
MRFATDGFELACADAAEARQIRDRKQTAHFGRTHDDLPKIGDLKVVNRFRGKLPKLHVCCTGRGKASHSLFAPAIGCQIVRTGDDAGNFLKLTV